MFSPLNSSETWQNITQGEGMFFLCWLAGSGHAGEDLSYGREAALATFQKQNQKPVWP